MTAVVIVLMLLVLLLLVTGQCSTDTCTNPAGPVPCQTTSGGTP